MATFLIVYLSVYLGVHALFFFRIRVLFTDKVGLQGIAILFFILMMLAPIASQMLERNDYDLPARIVAFIGFCWMGFAFFAFAASLFMSLFDLTAWGLNTLSRLVTDTRFSVPLLSGKMPALTMVIVVSLFCIYGVFEARIIRIERLSIETDKLPLDTDSLTIAQISDVHLGLIIRGTFLESLVGKLESIEPDILVCTGDLVDSSSSSLPYLIEYFERLQPRYGKYAVTGNHEYYAGLDRSLASLRRSGFTVLRGESRIIADLINIAGVDDSDSSGARREDSSSGSVRTPDPLSGTDNGRFTLFLKHRPEITDDLLGRFDLQLSGHTHKGQMFPFNYLVKRQYPLMDGLHDLGKGSKIYINRGTGTWGPPMRIFSPPEITVITLNRPVDA